VDPTPHRPEATNPLDELSPNLRTAVEATRNQPVPPDHQEETLRRIEKTEPPRSNRLAGAPFWTRPSMALAVLAASVAIAFCTGYWVRPTATAATPTDSQYAKLLQDPEFVEGLSAFMKAQREGITLEMQLKDPNHNAPIVQTSGDVPAPQVLPETSVPPSISATGPGLPRMTPSGPPQPGQPGMGGGATAGTGSTITGGGFGGPGGPGGTSPSGVFGGVAGPYPGGPGMGVGPVAPGGPPPGPFSPGSFTGSLPPAPSSGAPTPVTGHPNVPVPQPQPPVPGTVPVAPVTLPGLSPAPIDPKVPTTPAQPDTRPLVMAESLKVEIGLLTEAQKKTVAEVTQMYAKNIATARTAEEARQLQKNLTEGLNSLPADTRDAIVAALQVQPPAPLAEVPSPESYNYFVDNPYQAVQNAPLSTFSTTVDTASYSNVRRFLMNDNRLPPRDAVRVADLLNYFPYAYPQPKGDAPVAFTMNMTTCPWNADHQLLRVAVAARTYTAAQMPPRNLVFLLDTSGSMSPEDRLPLLIKGFKLLVEQLRPQDRVAIVVYASATGLLLPSTPGNEKAKINAALDTLHANGSTNGGDGIQMAYKIAQENFIKGGVNRVILGTDGDWNVGITNHADLIRLIEEKRKTGVYLTVLGVGRDDLKDGMMERLAHHGAGHYCYVNTMNELKKIFVEQGGALSTVAKDVKVQIEFNPQRVAGYRLIGYENKLLRDQDFNDDTIHAGDMGSGHTVTALYEIVPAGLKVPSVQVEDLKYQKPTLPAEAANTGEFLTVKMRYKDPEAETSKKLEQPLAGAVQNFEKAHEDIRWAAAVAEFGMLLRGSPYKGTATYTSALHMAERALGGEDAHRVEFLSLVKKARELSKEK
jgi:Ca-activated chloride channel family protein